MPKHLHKIFLSFCVFSLLLSPLSLAEDMAQTQNLPPIPSESVLNSVQNSQTENQTEQEQLTQQNTQDLSQNINEADVKVNDEEIEPINTAPVKKEVVPDSKKEGKKVINLFLKVMGAVLLSGVFLFIILSFVKKYYASAFVEEDYEDYESLNLNSPNNKEEALKSFLNRTK